MESINKKLLVGPCGINCGICSAFLREKNKCPGSRGADIKKPVTRVKCKIKTCEVFRLGKIRFCFEYENFPCDNLNNLGKRYRTKYNPSLIENSKHIK
jgi:hypothetical protein